MVPLHSVQRNYRSPWFSLDSCTGPNRPNQNGLLANAAEPNQSVNEDECFVSLDAGEPSLSELVQQK